MSGTDGHGSYERNAVRGTAAIDGERTGAAGDRVTHRQARMQSMSVDPYQIRKPRLRRLVELTRRQFLLLVGAVGGLGGGLRGPGDDQVHVPERDTRITARDRSGKHHLDNAYMDYAHRVGIMRDDQEFYAVQLICTHLGGTPNYVTNVTDGTGVLDSVAENCGVRRGAERIPKGWACPCHGSRYYIDSINFYGPAPRPMDWVNIQFGPDGKFAVDRSKLVVLRQAGETTTPR